MDTSALATYNYHQYPWYSPIEILNRFQLLRGKYGEMVLKPEFKKAREMFTGAVALLGAYELSQENKYWLQINRESASPDVMAVKLTEKPDKMVLLEINQMEVTEYEEHSRETNVVDFLKRTKLSSHKSYNQHTMIICLVNRKSPINHDNIVEELKKIQPKSTIYILGRPFKGVPGIFTIFSPYPAPFKPFQYDVDTTSKKYEIPHQIRLSMGIDQKISYKNPHEEVVSLYDTFGLDEDLINRKYQV